MTPPPVDQNRGGWLPLGWAPAAPVPVRCAGRACSRRMAIDHGDHVGPLWSLGKVIGGRGVVPGAFLGCLARVATGCPALQWASLVPGRASAVLLRHPLDPTCVHMCHVQRYTGWRGGERPFSPHPSHPPWWFLLRGFSNPAVAKGFPAPPPYVALWRRMLGPQRLHTQCT